jgi:hypothetical protein
VGCRCGDRLTLTAEAGVVTARRDPADMVAMRAKPYIAVTAALRRRCGLEPGDRVLLAAVPAEDMLAASRSLWWRGPSAPAARSRTRKEDSHDRRPGFSGRVQRAAGGRQEGARGGQEWRWGRRPALGYCGVSLISTVFSPRLKPGIWKLDSAPIWPLYP